MNYLNVSIAFEAPAASVYCAELEKISASREVGHERKVSDEFEILAHYIMMFHEIGDEND